MNDIPKTYSEAILELENILSFEEKEELRKLPFISLNVEEKTDFFKIVIASFKLDGENDELLIDIARVNKEAAVNYDFLEKSDIADASNGARLILEGYKSGMENQG